jgi:formylglycine-generating enzyme required for sulfatase activity
VLGLAVVLLLGLLGLAGWEGFGRWRARQLCERLLESPTTDAPEIINSMRPYRRWADPLLREAYAEAERDGNARRQLHASLALLPVDPDQGQYLKERLAEVSAPGAPAEKQLELTKQQANLGVALLVMDRGDKVWPLLKHSSDPTLRSYLIERLGPGGVDAQILLTRLDQEKDDSIRRAILLSLGQFRPDGLPPAERQSLLPRLLDLYRNDGDPGIHGDARWLLKKWGAEEKIKEIDEAIRGASAAGMKRAWWVNSQGQTMVVISKPRNGVFWMGEGKARHEQPLDHDFAIASEAVTVEQFQRSPAKYTQLKQYAPTKECPVINVTWYQAAEYCNWLSKREGIAEAQWFYEPNKDGKYAGGMKIKAGYLRLAGYRLPTEAEWEYACRAGSTVGYSFGEPVELLEKYGWFKGNSLGKTHPCGTLKPNDLGLFDMQGNVWQWMQERFTNKPVEKENDGGELVEAAPDRVLRGGSWNYDATLSRAGFRYKGPPGNNTNSFIGFRLVRVLVEGK